MRLVLLDTAKIEVYKGKGFIGDRGGSEAESAGRRYEIPAIMDFRVECTRGGESDCVIWSPIFSLFPVGGVSHCHAWRARQIKISSYL